MNDSSDENPDYRYDPVAYEIEENARPDEMSMLRACNGAVDALLSDAIAADVLDLCCGTGLSMQSATNHPNVGRLHGVDECQAYLDYCAQKYSSARVIPTLLHGDAVTLPLPLSSYNVVILASAYHHIEDHRKVEFLRRVRSVIAGGGTAVLAENVLPEYLPENAVSYREAVSKFYAEVLIDAERSDASLPTYVRRLIQRVAQYGHDGDYEYKVSHPILLADIGAAGLSIASQRRVWPQTPIGEMGGNYVLTLRSID